nr:GNAT family N-acetyltransferase [uncultured Nocardioides sp.]
MGITTRILGTEDADALAALMTRIEDDHPTGFCLGAGEVRELMEGKADNVFEGAFDGDELVAYTALLPGQPDDIELRIMLFGDVDPARLGEGIGTLMLGRSLDRARAIRYAVAPELRASVAATALAGRDDQTDLVVGAGMRPRRHSFLMVADLDRRAAVELPAGYSVTAFDPEAADELRRAHNAAFAGYPDRPDAGSDFWAMFVVGAAHARHALSAVARDGRGSVAGYVLAHEYAVTPSGGPGPEVHVPYVGTLPGHRRRGLASGLLAEVMRRASAAGYVTASLHVDAANPTGALGLYERAGFRQVYRQDSYVLEVPRVGERLSR